MRVNPPTPVTEPSHALQTTLVYIIRMDTTDATIGYRAVYCDRYRNRYYNDVSCNNKCAFVLAFFLPALTPSEERLDVSEVKLVE